jgi:fermentation-respiration switch protein FrsA (DUF1100 family)
MAIFAVDYRGYGLSSGRPSEEGLYKDVEATVRFFLSEYARTDRPTVYWGRSLGGTMAAYASQVAEPDGLVLEASFPDARSIAGTNPVLWFLSIFSSYRFPTVEWLEAVRSPILVMHGTHDRIIPFKLGRALFDEIENPRKRFLAIDRGDHNDIVPAAPGIYWEAAKGFIEEIASCGAGEQER